MTCSQLCHDCQTVTHCEKAGCVPKSDGPAPLVLESLMQMAASAAPRIDPAPPSKLIDSEVRGYDRLAHVLGAAFDQAANGKGKERHANALPFDQQPMQVIARAHGIGFITGQAAKKLEEAVGMLKRGEPDAAIKEMLGAIVYAAGAVIYVQDRKGGAQ